jgi:N-acetyl-anhydromuramyl-L-alanine amidase AmpD
VSVFDLANRLVDLKATKKAQEDDLDYTKEQITKIEELIVDLMVQDEIQNFNMDGRTFYLSNRLHASIPADEKENVIRLFKEHPFYSGLVKESIDSKTLSAWVKERREEGDMPKEIEEKLSIYEKTVVGVRKS